MNPTGKFMYCQVEKTITTTGRGSRMGRGDRCAPGNESLFSCKCKTALIGLRGTFGKKFLTGLKNLQVYIVVLQEIAG